MTLLVELESLWRRYKASLDSAMKAVATYGMDSPAFSAAHKENNPSVPEDSGATRGDRFPSSLWKMRGITANSEFLNEERCSPRCVATLDRELVMVKGA